MPTKKDHTIRQGQVEESSRWSQEVMPRLPKQMEVAAQQQKAFVRRREVASASILLRAILSYVLGVMSFREWGAWAVIVGIANISEAAWRKRLRNASAWLLWLFNELVAVPNLCAKQLPVRHQRVLLIDATRLRQPGGSGDDQRLHCSYNLLAGQFVEIAVTDWSGAEQLDYYHLQAGDIALTDAGYGIRRNMSQVMEQQAYGVIRIFPTTFPVEDEQGQPVDLFAWIREPGERFRERRVFFADPSGQRHAIRVIAGALPPEKAEIARCRKRKVAQKHGRTISNDTLLAAGWVILVTNLPTDLWSVMDILFLYRARWQIELIFKRMKQVLKLDQLRCKHPESVEASIRALLVAWALQEQEVARIRNCLQQLPQSIDRVLSTWTMTKLALATLRQQVIGPWSQERFDTVLPFLTRFLSSPVRKKRSHQETTVRDWLLNRFSAPLFPAQTVV